MRMRITDLPPAMQKQVLAQLQDIVAAAAKTKYRNVPVKVDGERYDSKLEFQHCEWLRLRQKAGEVSWFIRQAPFRLEGGVIYRADTLVSLVTGPPYIEVWDAKGRDTQASINKRKQVKARYGVDVQLWKSFTTVLRANKGRAVCA